jgi:glyceraldehyde-3-phosphate dehydrogenase type II
MKLKKDVLVMGVGTIGEPLTRLLLTHRKELGVGEIYFAKASPNNLSTVRMLVEAGAKFCVWEEMMPKFTPVLERHKIEISGTIEEVLQKVAVVADCTNRGNVLKKDLYENLDGPYGFFAQGSEEGFGHPVAYGINFDTLKPGDHNFIQVVSCNTHNVLAVLRVLGEIGGEIDQADFVLMRRMNDISQTGKAIPSPEVDPIKEKYGAFGSHQAYDANRVMRTIDQNMEGRLHSTALKLDNQLMHMNRFRVAVKKKLTKKTVLSGLYDDPMMSVSYLNSMNLVFSKGRDHGFYGRIFNQAVVVRSSIEVSPDGHVIYGTCFTPQDGNSLMTSIATTLWLLDPKNYRKKMKIFNEYIHRFRTIPA